MPPKCTKTKKCTREYGHPGACVVPKLDPPQTDHKADALEVLRAAEEDGARGQSMAVGIALAQAHASLAIAEALESANQDRREQRASAVEELRELVREVLNGEGSIDDWNPRARKTLSLFEAAEHV